MRTDDRQSTALAVIAAAALLLWPALWNGYPLVFADTGTYLAQAINWYAGWDRPVFYSLFLFPLHMTLTTWPCIAVQALLVAHVLHLVRRALLPQASVWWLIPLATVLAVGSPLPWFASQLMPDVFTGLLVLVLVLLILAPAALSRPERLWLVALAGFMIAAHQSHIPLTIALLLVLLPLRSRLARPAARGSALWSTAPLVMAVVGLLSVNLVAFGRASLSPFGNVFLLARVIYDGPGKALLQRDCPAAGWRLCAYVDNLPADSDKFLWQSDGPVTQIGAKIISLEAGPIIRAALAAAPGAEALAFARNSVEQLSRFATGDGLQAWPAIVTPHIRRNFPSFEAATYAASRQSLDELAVPAWLQIMHAAMAIVGVTICVALLAGSARRNQPLSGFAGAVLLALLVNASITGGLSGPHDRYQSRIVWLAPMIAVLAVGSLRPLPVAALTR